MYMAVNGNICFPFHCGNKREVMHRINTELYCNVTNLFRVASNKPMNLSTKHNLHFETKQDIHKVRKMRRFRATIFGLKKEIIIKYSECVLVPLAIQHAMHMHHIFVCGVSGFTRFSHIMP
jgi:hypothetical protein